MDRDGHLILAAVAAFAALAACDRDPRWINIRATELHVGGFVAPIPAGWRDVHELVKQPEHASPKDLRTLVPEDDVHRGEISVFPIGAPIIGEKECNELAASFRHRSKQDATLTDVRPAQFDGDPGCLMSLRTGNASGLIAVRTHAGSSVAVRCLGYEARLDGGGGCDKVVYGLRVAR